jgi:hypothetical protein
MKKSVVVRVVDGHLAMRTKASIIPLYLFSVPDACILTLTKSVGVA